MMGVGTVKVDYMGIEVPEGAAQSAVDNKTVYLVGTVHVSKESARRVEETIRTVLPGMVCIELDAQRFKAMQEMTEGGHFRYSPTVSELLTLPGILKWLQQEIGSEFGVAPGLEMAAASEAARKCRINIGLIDRPIDITIARMWGRMPFRERVRLVGYLAATGGVFLLRPIFGKHINNIASIFGDPKGINMAKLEQGGIGELMEIFKQKFPHAYKTLVEERDVYMCNSIAHILERGLGPLVVVVGIGHVAGIQELLKSKGIRVVVV